jgi:VWFA-related protein
VSMPFRTCLSLLCLSGIALAQQATVPAGPPAQSEPAPASDVKSPQLALRPPPKPEGSEGTIQLDVVVTGKQGGPVTGLGLKDFVILDNKKSQDILSFHAVDSAAAAADRPVEVILLLDLVNSTFEQASVARAQIQKSLEQNGGHLTYPTSIMILTQGGLRIQPRPSTDGNALVAVLGQVDAATRSVALGEVGRFQLSVRSLASIAENKSKSPSRKILVWTGPGWPIPVGSNPGSSSQERERTFDAIVEISTRLRESHIALYSISPTASPTAGAPSVLVQPHGGAMPGSEAPQQSRSGPIMSDTAEGSNYKEFLRGVKSAHQAEAGDLALQVFAVQSGGRVLDPSNDLAGQIARCVEDLTAFYTISFTPAHADHANDYHDLKVQVSRPGLAARTNTGYYNQP